MEVKRSQIKLHQWITSPLCPSVDRVNFIDLLLGTCSALEIKLLFNIYQHPLPLQTQVVNKTNQDEQHSKKRKLNQQLAGPSSTAGGDMTFETKVSMDLLDSGENNDTFFDPEASQEQDSTAQSPPSSTIPTSRLGLECNLKVELNSDETCPEMQANRSDNRDGIDGAQNHASSKQENADQDSLEENRNNSHQQSEQTLPAARKVRKMPGRCRFCGKFFKVRPSLATPRKGKQNKDIIPPPPSSPACNICLHHGKHLM